MYIQNLSNYDFLKLIGVKIKEIRTQKEYSQEYLSKDVCARTTLSKLEKGLLKNIDINILFKLSNKLDLAFNVIIESIMLEVNADIELTKEAYLLVCKCNISDIDNFNKQIVKNTFYTKQIEVYLLASCSFLKKDYNAIISLLGKTINNIIGLYSVIDILIINYYILSFIYLNADNIDRVLSILHLVQNQNNSINYYLKYYPQIMIRMLINITEYYCFINDCNYCSDIFNIVENYCYKYELYDSIIDIYLCKLNLAIKQDDHIKIKEFRDLIEAYLFQMDFSDKRSYIKTRYFNLSPLSKKRTIITR